MEIFITVVIAAGTGTAIVEIILKLFLNHWLDKQLYKFKLKVADKRACADAIIELISSKKYQNWYNLSDDVYYNAYTLSDRLITLKEKDSSHETYLNNWNATCQARGLPNGCSLDQSAKVLLDKGNKDMEDNCFKLYPAN